MEIELVITDIGFGGEGVGRYQNQVVFVPFVAQGEKVKVKIVQRNRNFLRAELIEILEKSNQRAIPSCPYFGQCGGCQYQHLVYAEQLRIKEEQIRQILKRIGKVESPYVLPIIGSPQSYGYRNRIVVHADQGRIGFRNLSGETLLDIQQCEIASEEVNQALTLLRQKRVKKGHFSLREKTLPHSGFYQTNRFLLEKLRDLVAQSLPEQANTLVEGYCGAGFFTASLAPRFQNIIAVDTNADSIRQAPTLANVVWRVENLETTLARERPDVLLVDPPREGLSQSVIDALNHKKIKQWVYVSCNPATLARDINRFSSSYTLEKIQPIDLFPQTAQVEIVANFKSKLV